MTISTYSELVTAIGNWYMNRTDVSGSDRADEIIDLSEAYFNATLRCREMEAVTDLTPTSNVCTLPSDYLEYKRVVELASIRRPLEYITEDAADYVYPDRTTGLACHFMIVGSDLTALPLSSNNIELTYYQKIPALSSSNTTNWLLTRYPNIYLHACRMHAAMFTFDQSTEAVEAVALQKHMDSLMELDNRMKFGNAGVTITGNVW